MTISFETFVKHAEIVCKNETDSNREKPILKGIRLLDNGDAVVTDAHRMYLAKGIHNQSVSKTIAPNGKVLEGDYPDVKRIIPSSEPHQSLELNTIELHEAAYCIYGVGSVIEEKVLLHFDENLIKYDSIHVKYQRAFPVTFNVRCFVNAKYFLDAVKFFKAVGSNLITLQFYGAMRPIKMTNEDESLIVLVLPIKKH